MEDCNRQLKLSIIIPMYNAEKYIANCIDSILKSDLSKDIYEILVINDGSKDRGPEIVQEYVSNNSNIHYLSQENQGQSSARNNGINHCCGKYVWFIDADDKVDSNCNQIIKELSSFPQVDILAVKLRDVEEDGSYISDSCAQPTLTHNQVMSGREAIISGYNPSSVCALITKRELFIENNFYFVPGITHQDVELSYRLMAHAQKVIFTHLCPYIYIQHPTSVSHNKLASKKLKYLSDDITILHSFENLSKEFTLSDPVLSSAIDKRIKSIQLGIVWGLLRNKKSLKEIGIYNEYFSLLKKENVYPLTIQYDSFKKRAMAYLLNLKFFFQ